MVGRPSKDSLRAKTSFHAVTQVNFWLTKRCLWNDVHPARSCWLLMARKSGCSTTKLTDRPQNVILLTQTALTSSAVDSNLRLPIQKANTDFPNASSKRSRFCTYKVPWTHWQLNSLLQSEFSKKTSLSKHRSDSSNSNVKRSQHKLRIDKESNKLNRSSWGSSLMTCACGTACSSLKLLG